MAIPAQDPFITYLVGHVNLLRRRRDVAPAAAATLDEHAHALELLADVVRDLADDDERLLTLATLAVRHGQFVPGPASDHALTRFAGRSREICDAFVSALVRIARDDSLARARDHGVLPPKRPH
jgi:hypothetical protein